MLPEIIFPTDKQHWLECRAMDITSTDVAALFGISPYLTEFELFHRKKEGSIVEIEENQRMRWGSRLQDAIAAGVADEQGWVIRRMNEYMRDPGLHIGASFDFSIEATQGLLEIKNVDGLQYKQKWLADENGNIEAPLWIEIQVQHQLAVSGRGYAYIAALVGGNELVLLHRLRNEKVIFGIKQKVAAFWKSIDENSPPKPNFELDADFIKHLYGYAEVGKFMDVSDNEKIITLAADYKKLGDEIKVAEKMRNGIKAELLTIIEDAEKVRGDNFTISAGMVGPSHIEYERDGYRNFRISWREEK